MPIWLLGFLCAGAAAFGQGTRYSIRVQVQDAANNLSIAPYIEIMIGKITAKANENGIINFYSATPDKEILVTIPDEKDFVLVTPPGVPLPADPNALIPVLVRKPSGKEEAMKQVSASLKKLNLRIDKLDSIRFANGALYALMSKAVDSIYAAASKAYPGNEADLRSATAKMQGRDIYFPAVSGALEDYLNSAKDIRDIFRNMMAFSLENPAAFRLFDSTINVYNNNYNVLNTHNAEYEKAVLDYWGSTELSLGFHNVFDFAINNIHRASILPLNGLLNEKVREYVHEDNRKRRKQLRGEILATLDVITPTLDNSLTILESKVRYYIIMLQTSKNTLAFKTGLYEQENLRGYSFSVAVGRLRQRG